MKTASFHVLKITIIIDTFSLILQVVNKRNLEDKKQKDLKKGNFDIVEINVNFYYDFLKIKFRF